MISSRATFPPKAYETKVQGSEFTPPVHNDLSICYPPSGACNLNKEEMQKRGNKNIDARKSLNELVLGNSASFGDEIVNIASVLTSPITAVARLAREHSSVSRAFFLTSSVFVHLSEPYLVLQAICEGNKKSVTKTEALLVRKAEALLVREGGDNACCDSTLGLETQDISSDDVATKTDTPPCHTEKTKQTLKAGLKVEDAAKCSINAEASTSSGITADPINSPDQKEKIVIIFPKENKIKAEILKALSEYKEGNLTDNSYLASEMEEYALLSQFPYFQDRSSLPEGWVPVPYFAKKACESLGSKFQLKEGTAIVTTNDGLTAAIFIKENEICVVYGGTSAGKNGSGHVVRQFTNMGTVFTQWKANVSQAVKYDIPASYQQGADLALAIKTITNKNKSQTVTTAGHSLGGGLAAFAAAMAGTPNVPMTCHAFCAAEAGLKIRIKVADKCESAAEAESLVSAIKHLVIKGDPVHNVSRILGVDLNLMGTVYTLDPNLDTTSWFGWAKSVLKDNGVMIHLNYYSYIHEFKHKSSENTLLAPDTVTTEVSGEDNTLET